MVDETRASDSLSLNKGLLLKFPCRHQHLNTDSWRVSKKAGGYIGWTVAMMTSMMNSVVWILQITVVSSHPCSSIGFGRLFAIIFNNVYVWHSFKGLYYSRRAADTLHRKGQKVKWFTREPFQLPSLPVKHVRSSSAIVLMFKVTKK